ncbi:MAG TPA: methionyl-tRNA formyltransferase [Jatrophihabitans sp.]|nr:methionyl-tRNA formyltransferase [Jatrophihabitans sp.]
MRLAFAGTPATAVPTLRALLDAPQHEVVAVITRPAARAGRGRHTTPSPVAQLAAEAGIPVLAPVKPSEPEFLDELAALAVDCCPVVAYGALLPPAALAVPAHGWVNLHFSLLPAWRGAAPVQHALLRGDDVTGASTFLIEQGLDTGPVYGVVTERIRPDDTAGDLLGRLADSGAALMVATMDGIADGSLVAIPQSTDGVSMAPKLTVADAEINWNAPAQHIDRLVRACIPNPGPWTRFRGERLKLGALRTTETEDLAPGQLHVDRRSVTVGTAGVDVELGQVQPPGKRPMPAADWARGARIEAGERLG